MEIKALDVKKLRDMTGAGMMDCKNALVQAEGNFERAQEIIREKGKLVAAKRADRETTEGAVITRIEGNKGIIVCLGCETDFVSKNEEFQTLANTIADAAIKAFPADIEGLKAVTLPSGDTVETAVTLQTGKTGEKHTLAFYAAVEAPYIAAYMHKITGKLAAISVYKDSVPQSVIDNELTVAIQKTKEELIGKAVDAALKKAGINPAHVDSEDHIQSNTAKGWLTPEQADQARSIKETVAAEKAANLNEDMIKNIANGRLSKFFKEQTLVEQEYQMGDGKQSVREFLAGIDKEIKVVAFKRFSLAD